MGNCCQDCKLLPDWSLPRKMFSFTKVGSWYLTNKTAYYTLNSLSLFWLADSVQLIFEIRACDVVTADYSIIMSRSRLRLITLTETLIILDITKTESNNCFIIHWTKQKKKTCLCFFTDRKKKKRVNLTWLPWEIMHRGHTRHDYPWPWHDYWIICSYDVIGADFEN